ncbi:MAG: RnfABCDGE type electron transport complex subunit D [Lachnospiraceae bacterium]|nr:RnfABCDGE type electron transport complex subunit D [Lachnospiraceae bacterium]
METEEKKEYVEGMSETKEKPTSEETETVTEAKKTDIVCAPFLKNKDTTTTIMRDVVIALLPAALFGIYRFGFRAFLIMLLSVTSCVLTEHVCKRIRRVQESAYECSAVVTGLLMGMMLPLNVPYWFPIAGGVFAIGIIKQLFGGLGRNRLNPAASAKCLFLVLVAPLMGISMEGYPVTWSESTLSNLFFGFSVGMAGEVSTFLLLLGGLYLVFGKVISLHTPVAYLVSFAAVMAVFGGYGTDFNGLAMQLCIGGVVLGAFFLATDYTTSPLIAWGKVMFGVIVGGLTAALRIWGFTVEAVVYAVVLGNVLVPVIDIITLIQTKKKDKRAK